MSDIGPGDWVQCIRAWRSRDHMADLTEGAVYQIAFTRPARSACTICGSGGPIALRLVGQEHTWKPTGGHCFCMFRKWPGPADEALREERSPYHEQTPVTA